MANAGPRKGIPTKRTSARALPEGAGVLALTRRRIASAKRIASTASIATTLARARIIEPAPGSSIQSGYSGYRHEEAMSKPAVLAVRTKPAPSIEMDTEPRRQWLTEAEVEAII